MIQKHFQFKQYNILVISLLFLSLDVFSIEKKIDYSLQCPIDHISFINDDKTEKNIVSLKGSSIQYLKSTRKIHSYGQASMFYKGYNIMSEHLTFDQQSRKGKSTGETYSYGKGQRVWSTELNLDANNDMRLLSATYSRCSKSKDELDWKIKTSRVNYNHEGQSIDLYNAVVWFKAVPFFYTPWANVPLTRRSGLLLPTIGQKTLSEYGWYSRFYQQPIYFNLADYMDDTLQITWLGNDRPQLISNEFRYLGDKSNFNFILDNMKEDFLLKQTSNHEDNKDYQRLILKGNFTLNNHWGIVSNWLEVYPRNFHDFFPTSIFSTVLSGSINRALTLTGKYNKHTYKAEVYDNISLTDHTQDGYLALPKLSYNYNTVLNKNNRLDLSVQKTRLQTPEERTLRNYSVLTVNPLLSKKSYNSFYQTHLELGLVLNQYDLEEQKILSDTLDSESFDHSMYYTKVGVELFFDNTQHWYQKKLKSLLSPLLYHIYSPYQDPGNLPFSGYSAVTIDTFRSLLGIKNYNRSDYLGESNRLVAGVSQLFIQQNWNSRFTVGKNHHLEEHTVDTRLPTLDEGFELWFAETSLSYQLLRLNINTQWDNLGKNLRKVLAQIYIENKQKDLLRINYSKHNSAIETEEHKDDEVPEFASMGVSKKVFENWRFATQLDHNLTLDKSMRRMIGFIYSTCCWEFNSIITAKPYEDDFDYTINLGFVLKGLFSFGPSLGAEKTIYNQTAGIK